MSKNDWQPLLQRSPDTHKYDYGHVLVIGGSPGMVGAPVLVARAAMRTGAGLVTIASTADVVAIIDRDIEEIMTVSLSPWGEGEKCVSELEVFVKKRHVTALVVGPGLPPAADEVIRGLLSRIFLPVVVDAEALSALGGHLEQLQSAAKRNNDIILTPHLGEYARLIKGKLQYSADSEQASAKKFASDFKVTFVLKRHRTLVFSGEGDVYENTTGNPGLATAGSGDVLAGTVAALLAQKLEPYIAAKMAVQLHGIAGDIAAELKTQPGMIASDIIEAIPAAFQRLATLR